MAEQKKQEVPEQVDRWPPQETRQHLRAARAEIRESFKALFPPEYIQHRRRARREALLAARSLIDHALQRLEED